MGLLRHLSHASLHQTKNAIQIDRQRRPPLRVRHGGNRLIVRRPHAVVHDQAVQPPKRSDRSGNQCAPVRWGTQRLLDSTAKIRPTKLRSQRFRRLPSLLVAENDLRACLPKHPHRSRANAARTTRYQRDLTFQRENHTAHPRKSPARILPRSEVWALYQLESSGTSV